MRRWFASLSAANRAALETGLTLIVVTALAAASGVLSRFDNLLYDQALSLKSRPAPEDIVIVAIDERSLAALGRWPWSRALHATLVDRLAQAGSAVVAFDILFAEPESDDPLADVELARAIAAHGRVVLPLYTYLDARLGQARLVRPLPVLEQAAAALGHVEVEIDADAVVRRKYLYAGIGSPDWPALALAAAQLAAGSDRRPLRTVAASSGPRVHRAELLVPYAGGDGHFRRVSAVDVLREPRIARSLRGSLVLIGATAAGLQRDFATPVSGVGGLLSSVELHANLLDALRRDLGIERLGWPWVLALALAPLLLGLALYGRRSARGALLINVLLLGTVMAISILLLHLAQRWLQPAPALLAVLLSYPLYTWRRSEATAQSLASEQQKQRATLEAIADAVFTIDRDGRITFANAQAERISGRASETARGRRLVDELDFPDPGERARLAAFLDQCARGAAPTPVDGSLKLRNSRGEQFDVRVSASPVRLPDGTIDGVVVALTDLTETVAMTRRIAHQATHDDLTGLPNRTLLIDRLEHALAAARRGGRQVAVLFVDLDDFKRVNDGFGHPTGDELLRGVAQRLSAVSRASDTVARWGGDEFLVVVEDMPGAEEALRIARKLLEQFVPSFAALGNVLNLSASIGVSLHPRDGADPQTLLQNADRAMYRAKQQGGNRALFYAEDFDHRAQDRRELESGLREAIARDEFELLYQPQMRLRDRRICGAEVLLRWRHPRLGVIEPDRFVPIAEECGLIHEVGAWVVRNSCRRAAAWRDAGLPPVPLSVNVSPRQIHRQDLAPLLRAALLETRLDPAALMLEITESAMVRDFDHVAAVLREIRGLGVGISIDDFGTGYSSLSLLRVLPPQQIKIDRSFIGDVGDDPNAAAITRAVIAMARGMGVGVIAEGVETAAQFDFLNEHGCDAAQGYLISAPLEEAAFVDLLRGAATAPASRA